MYYLFKHYKRSEQRLLHAVYTNWQCTSKTWSFRLSKKAATMNNFDNKALFYFIYFLLIHWGRWEDVWVTIPYKYETS